MINTLINTIFPPQCLQCRQTVETSGNLCHSCWEKINFIASPECNICGIPFELEAVSDTICGQCIMKPPHYSKARAVFKYDEASRDLITGFKYGDKIHASHHFASWIARRGKEIIANSDMIIPVPLHRIRLFTRRYNQSALLASSLGKITKLPVYNQALIRRKHTRPQAGLLFKQRIANVKGAFHVNPSYKENIIGKNIILIDDVMTTGATIDACSKILVKSGAASVNVLTMARTVKGQE